MATLPPTTPLFIFLFHLSLTLPILLVNADETDHVDLCLSTLKSDPHSFTTDRLGLTKITVNATTRTSDDITKYVKRLYSDAKAGRTKRALADCVELYEDAKDQFGKAVRDLNAGDDASANASVSEETCKDGFDEAGGSSHLS
ncbi:hypothetical protein QJS10_CPB22g00296 [Acorus calamus]|uniref:Pectinesterase inhibitor domain-containing protein n=1 Tax=Acorus calamus TaxID=4465 RepID=A0AAV9BZQ1_ACOCL|nr:hypothetical protein QJS10_CPB22g00296 [Acorus calamus]